MYFKVSAAWYYSHYLPPVSATLGKTGGKFGAGDVDTGGKFAASVFDTCGNFAVCVIDTSGKFDTGVVDTDGAPLLAKISWKFLTNL